MHKEPLLDANDSLRKINSRGACGGLACLFNPDHALIVQVQLEFAQKSDQLFLVERVPEASALRLPLFVSLREEERFSKEVLEHAFVGASLVDDRILCRVHVLHEFWVTDGEENCAYVEDVIRVLSIVEGEPPLGWSGSIELVDEHVTDAVICRILFPLVALLLPLHVVRDVTDQESVVARLQEDTLVLVGCQPLHFHKVQIADVGKTCNSEAA